MGGLGAGHKSERARRSRLVNIQKARAARKRAPLPWRSGVESRIIEQLVWQWWVESSGEWLVVSGEKKQKQVPHRHPAKPAGWVRDDNVKSSGDNLGTPRIVARAKDRPWAKYRVARLLGVSHTWVNKLVKRIEADPERMRRRMRAFAPASFEKLERAREETRRERERGLLRGPIRWRRVKVTLEGKERKIVAATRAERSRRRTEVERERTHLRQGNGEASGQALREGRVEMQRDSASRAGRVNPAPTKASTMPVRYAELPEWARGLLLPGDPGMTGRVGGRRTPRPVPFAFRRRR